MYVNKFDKNGECAKRGTIAEQKFEQWLISNGRKYRRATKEEQYRHVDFIIEHPEYVVTVDIKAPKKQSRNGNIDEEILWVEFKNVLGNAGWLYGGNEFLAFYTQKEDAFYVIRTSELAMLCEKLCNQGYTSNPKDALYKRYTRDGRKDEISMIKFSDIMKAEFWRIQC